MKTMRKPILLLAATLVATLLIVFCGTLFWIKSTPGLNWIQSQINLAIPGEVSVEKHRLSLLRPRLELYTVVLNDPQGVALAGFQHLSVELGWWALWRREILLERILLDGPWADLVVDDKSAINLVAALVSGPEKEEIEPPTPVTSGLAFNIVVETMALTNGRFTYSPFDASTRLEATGIDLSAKGNLEARTGNLKLSLARVHYSGPGIRPKPARIDLEARLDNQKLSVPALDIIAGQTRLTLSGSADDLFAAPRMEGLVLVDSQLAELKSSFNLAGDYTGPVNAKLSFKGPLADPDVSLHLEVGGGQLAGQPLDRGILSSRLQDRQVTIKSAALHLADGTVKLNGTMDLRQAFPSGFVAPPADANTIAYAMNLVADIPQLAPWLDRVNAIEGRLNGRLSLSGKGVTPAGISTVMTLEGAAQNLLAPGMDRTIAADMNLSAEIDRGKLSINQLEANADGARLVGQGMFEWDTRALEANVSLTAQDLSRALTVVGIPSAAGACQATLRVDGDLHQPQFSTTLSATDLALEAYTLGNLTLEADMDHDGRLNLTALTLHNQDALIHGTGQLRLLPGGAVDPEFINHLDLNLKQLSASGFMATPPILGVFNGRLKAQGPLASIKAELSLDGSGLGTESVTIGDIDTRMHWDAGTLFMDRVHLKNKVSSLSATGNIQLMSPGTYRLQQDSPFVLSVTSDHIDPQSFVDAASGDFTLAVEMTGSLNDPNGRISLTGRQATLAGQSVETIALDTRIGERRLWVEHLTAAVAPGQQIDASGWIGQDKSIDLQVKSSGIAASRIARLKDLLPGEGILRFEASAKGVMDNPDVAGHLTVSEITINNEAIDDFDLTFSLQDMRARAAGNLNFEVDAMCDLNQGDFEGHLIFDRTETAPYFNALGKPGFHGLLTGRVDAAGNFRDAVNASARIDIDALDLHFDTISLIQSEKIAMTLSEQKLSISEFKIGILSEGNLRLQGDARLDGRLDMSIDGRIPLIAARAFSDELAGSTGMVSLAGTVTGDVQTPLIDGRIELDAIGMRIPGLAQTLRDLSGSLRVTNDSIHIDELNGWLDTGSFSVDGTVNHAAFSPTQVDLVLNARSLPLEIPDTMAMLLNGNITITGNNDSAEAKGEIILLEGVYYKDVKLNLLQLASTATARQRTVAPASPPLAIPYFKTLNLNIVLGHRQPFEVQNNLAELSISPDLRIKGTLANPIVNGRAQIREGTVTFQKHIFEVNKGVIDFVNPYKTEAQIDIASQARIRTWTISLALKGTPDNLDIELSSVPTETESDILSLILFGRTARELTAGEGGAGQTTGQILAEMIASNFGDDLKKSTGVDILQVESSDSGDANDTGGVKVTVGKHLSDRMTVKYAIETKDGETTQRAITDYKLLEHILVSGFQDSKGIYGAELMFRIEFR